VRAMEKIRVPAAEDLPADVIANLSGDLRASLQRMVGKLDSKTSQPSEEAISPQNARLSASSGVSPSSQVPQLETYVEVNTGSRPAASPPAATALTPDAMQVQKDLARALNAVHEMRERKVEMREKNIRAATGLLAEQAVERAVLADALQAAGIGDKNAQRAISPGPRERRAASPVRPQLLQPAVQPGAPTATVRARSPTRAYSPVRAAHNAQLPFAAGPMSYNSTTSGAPLDLTHRLPASTQSSLPGYGR